ncbi:hypothetical protein [Planctobacterium marinum]|uniref:Uncharacterized protein n=1 Tax=Planctobacterium marinum TaxID=1631968 RepID=A0AA48HHH4_9ALTE|nr:hypothetical protein MACH26_02720 [Planctobacterium marinum]
MNNQANCCDYRLLTQRPEQQETISIDKQFSVGYFVLLLLALSAFTLILREGRPVLTALTYLVNSLWGFSLLLFTVSSFLYFSESETVLKKAFRNTREISLYLASVLFWWSIFYNSSNTTPFEWLAVFSASTTLLQLGLRFYCRVKYCAALAIWSFVNAVIATYAGIIFLQLNERHVGITFLLIGSLLFLAFTLVRNQSGEKTNRGFELLLIPGLVLMYSAVTGYYV